MQSELGRDGSRGGGGESGLHSGGLSRGRTWSGVCFRALPLWPVSCWGRDGRERALSPSLSFSPALSSLPLLEGVRISQVQLADSGTFTCVAASPAGVANRHFVLRVHGTEQGAGYQVLWPRG